MKVDREILGMFCRKLGPFLKAPEGLDATQLLWAIAGNESSFGGNISPRHEPGYCYKGHYFSADATKQYGCLAHCSFGPWQIMAPNAMGFSPVELVSDLETCGMATVAFLNREILGRQGAQTLDEIGDAYNSGNFRDHNIPELYLVSLKANYAIPLP